ncbi:conserved Plasmodium protein, unknown function [Plasmodium chabaudi chabaudi]|uniref:DNA-directed primase/polymerase protein n=1 Tax=Plasmodium chabaudi chabaudi TaxID=31271 RepID=A0A1C6XH30_PLACU|nr:conserved Plasmodium protein, unknown function [Plasmodium chabaudi chabaudi]
MVIDAESFYGKRKNNNQISLYLNVEKYAILKKIKKYNDNNTSNPIKKKIFYKQHDALNYYEKVTENERNEHGEVDDIINQLPGHTNSNPSIYKKKYIILYTEELENAKRCFIIDNFYEFLKFYSFYTLSLREIYYKDVDGQVGNFSPSTSVEDEEDRDMNLYELIISNEKRWLYFDIEYDNIGEYKNKDIVLFIFLIELCLFIYNYFNIKICLNDILILDSSTNDKISFHIIVKNIHVLNWDYNEYLINYARFFLNKINGNPDSFYEDFKNEQYKKKEKQAHDEETKNAYLLFENENSMKYFVDLFINYIHQTIAECGHIYSINLLTLFISKNKYTINDQEKIKPSNFDGTIGDINSIDDFSEISDVIFAIQHGKSLTKNNTQVENSEDKKINNEHSQVKKELHQYFSLYSDSIEDVVNYYINDLSDNMCNNQKKKYIILLYAQKKNENIENCKKEKNDIYNDETSNNESWDVHNQSENVINNYDDLNMALETEKNNLFSHLDHHENELNFNHIDENGKDNNVLLKCIIDNSVYSKNRNFRMIFSSKKNKKNKLLLSKFNVKPYEKKDINKLILKSLVTFYKQNDIYNKISEKNIFKYEHTEKEYGNNTYGLNDMAEKNLHLLIDKHLHMNDSIGIQIKNTNLTKRKQLKNPNAHKIISLNSVKDNKHVNNILKIIFFWNFNLYKNFKKNKIYTTKFRSEITKDYFYKIVHIHNNIDYDSFKCEVENADPTISQPDKNDGNNNSLIDRHGTSDNYEYTYETETEKNSYIHNVDTIKEYDEKTTKNNLSQKINHQNININKFNDLFFLENENFFTYLLNQYTNSLNKQNSDNVYLLIQYFISSISYNDEEYILNFKDNKYCKNIDRSHKSNHIYIIYNYNKNIFVQKCYDSECSHFVSDIYHF